MPFVRHTEEVPYIGELRVLIGRFEKKIDDELDALTLCCFELPYDPYYLIRDMASR